MTSLEPLNVTVTGAAGRIAYSLIPLLATGQAFGDRPISLRLLDIPMAEERLNGVAMEVEDSSYNLLSEVIATVNPEVAFKDCDVAILIGGFPRLAGMERGELLTKNAENIRSQADALNRFGRPTARVLVVANPANTNCLVALHACPNIPPQNFTCLTRLDEERLRSKLLKKLRVDLAAPQLSASNLKNVFILGNHSTTQVVYVDKGVVSATVNNELKTYDVKDFILNKDEYDTLLSEVQNRGAEIIRSLQVSSALSAAQAITAHLFDWMGPVNASAPPKEFSMGIWSHDNVYNLPNDLVFSLPCVRDDSSPGGYKVRSDLTFSTETQTLIDRTVQELVSERNEVPDYL